MDGISLSLDAGHTLGIVGESGCGKSVTALSIMGLVPQPPGRIAGGEILFEGTDLLQSAAGGDARTARRPHRDDLPGADDIAESGVHRRRPDRRRHPAASADEPRRGQGAGRRHARARAYPRTRAAFRRLSAQALGRDAPARDDRDGARVQAEAADRRRTHHRARRHHPGADPRPDAHAARTDRHRDHPHHARSRRRGRARRRRRRHVRRPRRRARDGRGPVRATAASVHHRPARLDPAPRRRAGPARRDRGSGTQSPRTGRRMPVSPALSVCRSSDAAARSRRWPTSAAGIWLRAGACPWPPMRVSPREVLDRNRRCCASTTWSSTFRCSRDCSRGNPAPCARSTA